MSERDRKLDDLDPVFKPKAIELIARCAESGIAVMVVETFRTEAQHQEDLAAGRSLILRSKHQDRKAIDLAPYETYQLHGADKINWDAGSGPDTVKEPWATMGKIGEALGLGWGGRWHKPFDAG